MRRRPETRTIVLLLVTGLFTSSVACAHVNRDELATDLDTLSGELRAEQQDSTDALNDRIDGVEARLDAHADEVDRRLTAAEERMEGLERALRELETEVGVTIERLETAIAFSVPVYFDFDSSTLDDGEIMPLDRFASVYTEYYGGNLITVEGFTDEAGSEEYNLSLGRRRAEEVKSYLTEIAGLDAETVRAVSYGEAPERLVAPGQYGRTGRENRRVVLVIDEAGTVSGPGGSDRPDGGR